MHEFERARRSPSRRLGERVRGLLDGERDRDPGLAYDLDGWHLALIVEGDAVEAALRRLAAEVDCRALCVPALGKDVIWAWLGSRKPPDVDDVEARLRRELPEGASVAVGEAHEGVEGWRLGHHDARAARRVLLHDGRRRSVRFRDVALEAAVLADPALAVSLVEAWLSPLDGKGDTGRVLRGTLRAYIDADRNVATSAAALGIGPRTVQRRLHEAEQRLGRPLRLCLPQIGVALTVEGLLGAGQEEGGEVG